ncbi:hypothetical protein F7Q99_07385 [Streptomyces kaniharaensis]|uniref:DUF559 domain-containing protein n=1 Tax=Streptomyces kaniharaensis TaxID=212423 RepID=A0A6N7KKR1_9ACTN|nr:hypothetical protein [Streptomyces kaniharaensis]MQS12120.1 hypothetical protein [Streptomyces kaniharaensis]
MTRANPLDPVTLLGADQQHIVTRAQLRRLGVPPGTIAHRLRAGGPWQQVLPRVICLQTGRLTAPQRLLAALAYASPKGREPQAGEVLLTGFAVLADAGLPSAGHPADLARVDVLIPGPRRVGDRGFVRIHRASGPMPGGYERDDGLWSTTVARALADLAPRETGQRRFRALCAEAVQRRHCELGELLDYLLARPGSLGMPQVVQVVEDLTAGVRSVVEGEARELLHNSGLPEPLWNPVLFLDGRFLAVPDAYWPHACVALEIDSRAWHLRPADHERGLARANRLTAAGLPVVRTTPVQLRRDPTPVLHELTALLTTGPHGPHSRISWRRAR